MSDSVAYKNTSDPSENERTVAQVDDAVTAPHKMSSKCKRESRNAVAGVVSNAVAASVPLRKLSDLPNRDR